MTEPTTPAAPVATTPSTHSGGIVGWLQEHLVPDLKEVEADAEKARTYLPKVVEFLPKVTAAAAKDPAVASALGPVVSEAEQLLSVLTAL